MDIYLQFKSHIFVLKLSNLFVDHAKRQYVYKSENTLRQPDEQTATQHQNTKTQNRLLNCFSSSQYKFEHMIKPSEFRRCIWC